MRFPKKIDTLSLVLFFLNTKYADDIRENYQL